MNYLLCPICDAPLQTCKGYDVTPYPPIDWPPPIGDAMSEAGSLNRTEQPELKEYHYHVGYIEHTAQLTPEMAETLGAKPIDEPLDDPSLQTNSELRGAVITSAASKARAAKNK